MWKSLELLQTSQKGPEIFQIIILKHRKYDNLKNIATVDGQVRSIGLQNK